MKHKYELKEMTVTGINNLEQFIEDAHRRYNCQSLDNDSQSAFQIYDYIVSNRIISLRQCLDYVFANNLWSAWRRGQSTFKDVIKENYQELQQSVYDKQSREIDVLCKEMFPND